MNQPEERYLNTSKLRVCYFEWGQPNAEPTILLAHATGFHARVWDQVIAHLPNRHVIAYEARGHGRTEAKTPYAWRQLGDDLVEFIKKLGVSNLVGVGHSVGGHCMTQAAALIPECFKNLMLVDPVILAPEVYNVMRSLHGARRPEDHPTALRRNHWSSWQDMVAKYEDRLPFKLWQSEVMEDYCRYGLLENPEGDGFVLACAPMVEASVYLSLEERDIYSLIDKMACPVWILRGKPDPNRTPEKADFISSPTWEGLAACFEQGRDIYLPELTHFIPMQDPELVARYILELSVLTSD